MVLDTFNQGPDTVRHSISGNTLSVFPKPDTQFTPGAVLQFTFMMERVSGTGGLEGRWKSAGQDYQLISGTLTEEQKADLDSSKAIGSGLQKYGSRIRDSISSLSRWTGKPSS